MILLQEGVPGGVRDSQRRLSTIRCQRTTKLFEGGVPCQRGFKPPFSALLILLGYAEIALIRQRPNPNLHVGNSRLGFVDGKAGGTRLRDALQQSRRAATC